MSNTKRISLTIASDILHDVDYLCNKLSVTRSSLISEFLRPTVHDVRRVVDFVLPESASDDSNSPKSRNPEQVREFLEGVLMSRIDSAEQLWDDIKQGGKDSGKH